MHASGKVGPFAQLADTSTLHVLINLDRRRQDRAERDIVQRTILALNVVTSRKALGRTLRVIPVMNLSQLFAARFLAALHSPNRPFEVVLLEAPPPHFPRTPPVSKTVVEFRTVGGSWQ